MADPWTIDDEAQPTQPAGPRGLRDPWDVEPPTQITVPASYTQDRTPEEPPPASGLDWADMGKGSVGALGRGTTGLLGFPGTVRDYASKGLQKLGVPEDYASLIPRVAMAPLVGPGAAFLGQNMPNLQRNVEDTLTGPFYEATTPEGKLVSSIAEQVPSALLPGMGAAGGLARNVSSRALNAVGAGAGSELGGWLNEGTDWEPWGRAAGGLMGGVLSARAVTPFSPARPAWQRHLDVLDQADVPLSAGIRTGSRPLQWLENVAIDTPMAGERGQALRDRMLTGYDRAITNRTFDPAELRARQATGAIEPGKEPLLPDQDVFAAGKKSLKDRYEQLTKGYDLPFTPQLNTELHAPTANIARRALPPEVHTGMRSVENVRDHIINTMINNGGVIPGDVYQSFRSDLGYSAKKAFKAGDNTIGDAYRDMQGALDRAMHRSLPPEASAAWTLNNQRYTNMKGLAQAAAAGEEHLSPVKVAQSLSSGRAEQFAAGAGNLDELARAGKVVLKPLPQSGTSPREAARSLYDIPKTLMTGAVGGGMLGGAGAVAGGVGTGLGLGILGAIGAAAAPPLAARATVHPATQAWLANQVLPQQSRDVLTQALVGQATATPHRREQTAAEQRDYNERLDERLRGLGYR